MKYIKLITISLLASLFLAGCGSFGVVKTTPQEKVESVEKKGDDLLAIYHSLKDGTATDKISNVAENGSGIKKDLAVEYMEWSEYCDYAMGYIIAKNEGREKEYVESHGYTFGSGSGPDLGVYEEYVENLASSGSHALNEALTGSEAIKNGENKERIVYEGNTPFETAFNDRKLLAVNLDYVVDGDTINVSVDGTESRVRLIGIDTDESVASDEYLDKKSQYTGKEETNSAEGKAASNHTKELLAGYKTLYLEFDEELYDPYNRVLAYVWLSTDTSDLDNMLQVRILDDGYARTLPLKPNTKYAKTFDALVDDGS